MGEHFVAAEAAVLVSGVTSETAASDETAIAVPRAPLAVR